MTSNNLKILIELIQKNSSRLSWNTTGKEEIYSANIGDGVFIISPYSAVNEYGEDVYGFYAQTLNKQGTVLDEMGAADGYLYQQLKEIHEVARNKALKIDQVYDSMFKEFRF